jgi:hypothetical protein
MAASAPSSDKQPSRRAARITSLAEPVSMFSRSASSRWQAFQAASYE